MRFDRRHLEAVFGLFIGVEAVALGMNFFQAGVSTGKRKCGQAGCVNTVGTFALGWSYLISISNTLSCSSSPHAPLLLQMLCPVMGASRSHTS